jgi:two-component sensor histidine kinase
MSAVLSVHCQESIVPDKYQSWNTSDGLQSSSIISAEINDRSELFLSHSTGIQKCDGSVISNYFSDRVSLGIFPTVHFSKENHLYIFNHSQIARFKHQDVLRLLPETLTHGIADGGRVSIINETEKEIWMHISPDHLCVIDKVGFKLTSLTKHKDYVFFSNTNCVKMGNDVFVIDGNCVKNITKVEKSLIMSDCIPTNLIIHNFLKLPDNDILFLSENKIYKGNNFTNNSRFVATLPAGKKSFKSCMTQFDNNRVIITFDNDIYILNISSGEINQIVKNKSGESFFKNGPIIQCKVDKYGNIYLISLAEGIVKFALPHHHITTLHKENKGSNFITSLYIDKKNRLILSGLFNAGISIDQEDGKNLFYDNAKNTPIIIWQNGDHDYYYTSISSKNLYHVSKLNESFKIKVIDTFPEMFSYYASFLSQKNDKIEIINGLYIYTIDHKNSNTVVIKSTEIPNHNNLGFNCGYKDERIYLGGYNEVIVLDTCYQFIAKYAFKDKAYIRKLIRMQKGNWWMASDKGLELFNSQFQLIKTYHNGPVFSIHSTSEDEIWCGTNNGIICLNEEILIKFNANDGLGCQEYNGHCVGQTSDGKLVLGGIGGIDIFESNTLQNSNKNSTCLLSDISINGNHSVIPFIKDGNLVLPHSEANLYLSFSAMGTGDLSTHIVQYRMLGMNNQWINGNQNRNFNYQLSPGTYELHYVAGKYFVKDPKSFSKLKIVVLPPYYKTWWFITLVTLAAAGFILLYIFLVNRIKFEKQKTIWSVRENLQNQKEEFTKELHDLIGSKISIISRNLDYILDKTNQLPLVKKQYLLTQTLHLSKQIAKDIRDTIWATDKASITIEDLVTRIQDFTFYYQHLPMQIVIHCDVETKAITLKPNEGLNLLRIIQEAIHNAAKHSDANSCDLIIKMTPNLSIEIIDHGKGMPSMDEIKRGHGLEIMEARAHKIDYSIDYLAVALGTHIKLTRNEKV